MRLINPDIKDHYAHVFNGGSVTTAELRSLEDRIAVINDAIDKCLLSKDADVLLNLDNELHDILVVLETSLENHPDKEIDL